MPFAAFIPLLSAAASGLMGLGSSMAQTKAEDKRLKAQAELEARRIAADKELAQQRTAADESALDPFRHALAQASALGRLDLLQNADFGGSAFLVPSSMQPYVPNISTFNYTPSADVRQSAGALKSSVMAGNTAPTMTNPANYGKTGVLDLLKVLAGRTPASSPDAFATPSSGLPQAPGARGVTLRTALRKKNAGLEY